jgi:hypothetical protein
MTFETTLEFKLQKHPKDTIILTQQKLIDPVKDLNPTHCNTNKC